MDADRDQQLPHEQPEGPPPRDGQGVPLLWVVALLAVVAICVGVGLLAKPPARYLSIPYNPTFLQQVRDGNVVTVSSTGSTIRGELRRAIRYPAGDRAVAPRTAIATEIPAFADGQALSALLEDKGVEITAHPATTSRTFGQSLLIGVLPVLLIAGLFFWLIRMSPGGGGGVTAFGRSRARRVEPSTQTLTFADVAGIDEALEELSEIVDFLKNPDKYRRLGGHFPRGVLLTGPPGTGKTLLARALAGEAGVPFFSIAASEFVEMFVGVGASRVRDLFAEAKQAAPAIIFIDELDAIGRSRGAAGGSGGAHEEREQTLNQILTEMDGFDQSLGVIVLSATNRPEIIDPALLRPGRFDRRVAVQPPDTEGRRRILEVHTRSVPLAFDVDLRRMAASTAGMVGADLANIVNEAALTAARRGHDAVSSADLHDALEKLVLGTERRIMVSTADRERTAYHEAGHALVGMLSSQADPVRKVSIIPRGQALGVTLSAPEADRFSYDEPYLRAKLSVLLGGRAAERMVYGSITTGAESDLREATDLARHMVAAWGMSDVIGPVAVLSPAELAGEPWPSHSAPETERLVDAEVRRALDEAATTAEEVLTRHREQLDALVHALLEHETLDELDAYAAVGVEHTARAIARPCEDVIA